VALGYRPPPAWLDAAVDSVQQLAAAQAAAELAAQEASAAERSGQRAAAGRPFQPDCLVLVALCLPRLAPDVAADMAGPGSAADALYRAAYHSRRRFSGEQLARFINALAQVGGPQGSAPRAVTLRNITLH
jgi:hypothetical protein